MGGRSKDSVQNTGVEHSNGDALRGAENGGFDGTHVGWDGGIDGGDE